MKKQNITEMPTLSEFRHMCHKPAGESYTKRDLEVCHYLWTALGISETEQQIIDTPEFSQ